MVGGKGGVVSCFHVGDSYIELRGGLVCEMYVTSHRRPFVPSVVDNR